MHSDRNPYDVRLAFVLDDEAKFGAALTKMLDTIGISARSFITPAEFLNAVDGENPDLVFLDLALANRTRSRSSVSSRRASLPGR